MSEINNSNCIFNGLVNNILAFIFLKVFIRTRQFKRICLVISDIIMNMNSSLKEKCTVVVYYCYLCRNNLNITSRWVCCKVHSFEGGYACRECSRPFSIGFELRRKMNSPVSTATSNVRVYVSASNVYFELVRNKNDARTSVTSEGSEFVGTDSMDAGGTSKEANRSDIYSSTEKTDDGTCSETDNTDAGRTSQENDYVSAVYWRTDMMTDLGTCAATDNTDATGTSEETDRVKEVYTFTNKTIDDDMCVETDNTDAGWTSEETHHVRDVYMNADKTMDDGKCGETDNTDAGWTSEAADHVRDLCMNTDKTMDDGKCGETDNSDAGWTMEETDYVSDVYLSTDMRTDHGMCSETEIMDVGWTSEPTEHAGGVNMSTEKRIDDGMCAETDRADSGGTLEETNHISNVDISTDKMMDGNMWAGGKSDKEKDINEVPDYSTFAEHIKEHANVGKTSEDTICTNGIKREYDLCSEEIAENSLFAEDEQETIGNILDKTLPADDFQRKRSERADQKSGACMFTTVKRTYNELDDTICDDGIKRERCDSYVGMSENIMLTEDGDANSGKVLHDTCGYDIKREPSEDTGELSDHGIFTSAVSEDQTSTENMPVVDILCVDDIKREPPEDTGELSEHGMFISALSEDQSSSETMLYNVKEHRNAAMREHPVDTGESSERTMFANAQGGDQTNIDNMSNMSVGDILEHPITSKITENIECSETSPCNSNGIEEHPITSKILKNIALYDGISKEYRRTGSVCERPVETDINRNSSEVPKTKAEPECVKKHGKRKSRNNNKIPMDPTVKSVKRNKPNTVVTTEPSDTWPFTCEVCGLGFRSQANLISHLNMHSSEKRSVCSVCRRSFSAAGYLKSHMRTHSEDRPFSCDLCQRRFMKDSQLQSHTKTHRKKAAL